MPAVKKPYKKRTKTTYKKRATSYKKSKVTKNSKGFVNRKAASKVELKRVVAAPSLSLTAATCSLNAFPRPVMGDASNQRNGRMIQIRGFQSRLQYVPPTTATNNNVRVIYFKWKEALTAPVYTDILATSVSTDGIFAPYNVTKSSIYDILADDTYNYNPLTTTGTAGNYAVNTGLLIKSKDIKFTQSYPASSGGPGDYELYYLIVSQSAATVTGEIAMSYIDV